MTIVHLPLKCYHLFVPRNMEEALNDPHWKLAIMKEMNA